MADGELVELNEAYAVQAFAPGLALFGGDGGNVGYAFDKTVAAGRVVAVPLVGMSRDEAEPMGSSLIELLRNLQSGG